MWLDYLLLFVLLVLMVAGVTMLSHVITSPHSLRDLTTVIPVATLSIIGMIHIIDHVITTILDIASTDSIFSTYRTVILFSFTKVNITVLVLLWRSVAMSGLTFAQSVYVFVFFVTSVLGVMSLRNMIPPGQNLTVMMSSLHPQFFLHAPNGAYLAGLVLEYLVFYVPSFLLLVRLWGTRSVRICKDIVGVNGCLAKLSASEIGCAQCNRMSPFLDWVCACLAVLLLLIRPLYILYYWASFRVLVDMSNDYFIFPVYAAICLVNVNFKTSQASPLPSAFATKGDKCVLVNYEGRAHCEGVLSQEGAIST